MSLNEHVTIASSQSDGELEVSLHRLAGRERRSTVELIVHLAEFDARQLYLGLGYGSMFAYCTEVLRLSEYGAYHRIAAARLSRRFPAILDMLAEGAVNLATLRVMGPHFTDGNAVQLLERMRGLSK